MSVLTFQLAKMGLPGYELDYDHVESYYEEKNYSHISGRMQRVEEADADWQRAYEMAKKDTVYIDWHMTHNFERWEDEKTPYYVTGKMQLLEGCDPAKECLFKLCAKFDANKTLTDRAIADDMIDAFARAIANAVANRKLGTHLATSVLFYNCGFYCVKGIVHEKVDSVMRSFIEAISKWENLSFDEMSTLMSREE